MRAFEVSSYHKRKHCTAAHFPPSQTWVPIACPTLVPTLHFHSADFYFSSTSSFFLSFLFTFFRLLFSALFFLSLFFFSLFFFSLFFFFLLFAATQDAP